MKQSLQKTTLLTLAMCYAGSLQATTARVYNGTKDKTIYATVLLVDPKGHKLYMVNGLVNNVDLATIEAHEYADIEVPSYKPGKDTYIFFVDATKMSFTDFQTNLAKSQFKNISHYKIGRKIVGKQEIFVGDGPGSAQYQPSKEKPKRMLSNVIQNNYKPHLVLYKALSDLPYGSTGWSSHSPDQVTLGITHVRSEGPVGNEPTIDIPDLD